MTFFILLASLLVLAAAGVAVLPLLRQSRRAAAVLLLLVPALVGGLYWYKGQPDAITTPTLAPVAQVQQAEAELVQRLAREPDNFEAWVLLGRMRMGLQKFDKASEAFAQAQSLMPDEPNLMVEQAEALMRASPDRRFPPGAVALLEKAIAGNPDNQRALFFLGMHRLQQEDYAGASRSWQQLLPLVDEKTAEALLPQINEARAKAGLPPMSMPAPAAAVTVNISISPALKAVAGVLFVYARAEGEAGPPVAAKRIDSPEFPLQVRLTDADSIMPTRKLSALSRIQVLARLSVGGTATPGAGDIVASPVAVDLGPAATAEIELSKIQP